MKNRHLGSDFDDFLREHGLLADAEAVAIKRVLAFQLAKLMEKEQISKAELARRIQPFGARPPARSEQRVRHATNARTRGAGAGETVASRVRGVIDQFSFQLAQNGFFSVCL